MQTPKLWEKENEEDMGFGKACWLQICKTHLASLLKEDPGENILLPPFQERITTDGNKEKD